MMMASTWVPTAMKLEAARVVIFQFPHQGRVTEQEITQDLLNQKVEYCVGMDILNSSWLPQTAEPRVEAPLGTRSEPQKMKQNKPDS